VTKGFICDNGHYSNFYYKQHMLGVKHKPTLSLALTEFLQEDDMFETNCDQCGMIVKGNLSV